jgi:hypothetical protein
MRFATTGTRMIRIGTAILLAVLASAAPGQTPPALQSESETPKAPPTVGRRATSNRIFRLGLSDTGLITPAVLPVAA